MPEEKLVRKTDDLILEARNFFNSYKKEIGKSVREGKNVIYINFENLSSFSHNIAELLFTQPEEIFQVLEVALEEGGLVKNPRTRILSLPETYSEKIRNLRAKHLNKLIQIEGIVRQTSEVRPQVVNAKFECPSCGTILSVLQIETKFREPSRCSCGRKGSFRLVSKDMVDAQRIVIEESPESLEGGEQPRRISVFLKEDLVEPKMEEKTTPGSRIRVIGILKEIPKLAIAGGILTRYDIAIEANNLILLEETFEELAIDEEDERQIRELAADPKVFEKFAESIAPSIYGYEEIKKALVLQLFGGIKKYKADGTQTRGDAHILLVGDPGVAKSQILKFISSIAPKGRYVAGRGTSGAGLCIAPDSLVITNPGGIYEIKDIVEENLKNYGKIYQKGIWNSSNPEYEKKIFTLNNELRLKPTEISQFWRIVPPEFMIKLKTSLGKEIIVTPNTKLYTSSLSWKEASEFSEGEYIATSRNLSFKENKESILTVRLIKSNPIVIGIKEKVRWLINKACKKNSLNKRELAKNLKLSEDSLYYNWVNEKARGNIKLKSLNLLATYAGVSLKRVIDENTKFSLYRGHSITLPKYINEDFLYFAGLIAGDGDLSKGEHTTTIRFSNDSKELLQKFKNLSKKLFNVKLNCSSKKSYKRAESWRFSSNLVFEVLEALGIPHSPKSHRLNMSNILLKLPNNLLAYYLKGYYDTDGGCVERKGKGGDYIESNSTSKIFSEKLKLILLRYTIISKIREREVKPGKIKSKYNKFSILIRGKENMEKFRKFINFDRTDKKQKLDRIINRITKTGTNIDIIPNARELIKEAEKDLKIKIMEREDKHGISRNYLQQLLPNLEKYKHKNIEKIKLLARSDIFWEKIIEIEKIKHNYKYVYDLTVNRSHNFIVNGILVHNTATVVRDEFLRGWSLEAGAMVLAHKGVLCIDELEKMDEQERSAMHESLEQQTITISKANVQACLRSETSVLAAANPKFGRFDPYQTVASQIDIPPTLINRFDIIFVMKDIPERAKDEAIATHVLLEHQKPEAAMQIEKELFRKYIAYSKQKIFPQLTNEAIEEIKKFYVDLRNMPVAIDQPSKPLPISARQLEALIRLSEASAKLRLSNKVTKEDAKGAIELMKYYLMQVGYDYETKTFDIDRIASGITTSQRGKILFVRETLSKLESRLGKLIPIDELKKELEGKISDKDIEESLDKLKMSGDIFNPRKGFVQRM